MNHWTPPGADRASHHALVDGVPQYLHGSFRDWFVWEFQTSDGYRTVWQIARMRKYDLAARGTYAMADTLIQAGGPENLFDALDDAQKLAIADWTVYDNSTKYAAGRESNEKLEGIIASGGSMWKVGTRDGIAGLERRVPEGIQSAAEAAMAEGGDSGRLLSEAWHAAFGLSPQADLAYRKAIEAVEAAVLPIVSPNDAITTLGKAIRQMRATGGWTLPFVKEHDENPSGAVVISMLQALWSGHSDRHPGTPSYVQSTPEAAETAVFLAVTLVSLFKSGAVARR